MELLKPGQIFAGRYRIERFLAHGGMGAVFVAEQIATELMVAVKVLFPHVLATTDAVDRFQLEARVAARVKSEHIVAVLDAGYDESTRLPFLVMELLSGQSLEDVVETSGPLGPHEAVIYLAQCASGLDRAHGYKDRNGEARPIVHRDLKPENLFLARRESGDPLVKILDFGIAKVLSDTANMSQELKGTPLFMAYEQASGQPITAQTDIWAFGLITFYLLTGKHYWRAAHAEERGLSALFAEVLTQRLEPASSRARQLGVEPAWGADFDAWFGRCVHRDPAERFTSAGAAVVALAAALQVRLPLPAMGTTSVREGALPDATAATLVAAGSSTVDPVALQTEGRPRRSGPGRWLAASIAALAAAGVAAGGLLAFGGGVPAVERSGPGARELDAAGSRDPHDEGPVPARSIAAVPAPTPPRVPDASTADAADAGPDAQVARQATAEAPAPPPARSKPKPTPRAARPARAGEQAHAPSPNAASGQRSQPSANEGAPKSVWDER